MNLSNRDVLLSGDRLSGFFRRGLFAALFFLTSFASASYGADGDAIELVLAASPAEAGETGPSGAITATAGTPLSISADAMTAWRFLRWQADPSESVFFEDENAENTFAVPSADAEISALFEAGGSVVFSTGVYPEGAGTVSASAIGQMNPGDVVVLSAVASSQDSLFYKWTCSDGAELLDSGKSSTELRISEGAGAAEISVIAHFLTRDAGADHGSAQFKSSYRGSISSMSPIRDNKALFKAVLPADLSSNAVSKDSILSMLINSGSISEDHAFSEDEKIRLKKDSGSVCFSEFISESKKACERIKIKWDKDGFNLEYFIAPPSPRNLTSIYYDVYGQGGGKNFPLDGEIPSVIVIEDKEWCFLWVADGGLKYAGKAKSSHTKKIGDQLVSWDISGKGSFARYSWRQSESSGKMRALFLPGKRRSLQSVAMNAMRKSSSARSFQKNDIDTGNMTKYPIWQKSGFNNYGPVQMQAPFFFNGKIYSLSRPTSSDANYKKSAFLSVGSIDDSGFIQMENSYPLQVGDPKVALFGDATKVTTCVFKGKVHLFYDIFISDQQYYIYSCSSSHPEAAWENKGFLPMTGTYSRHGGFKHTPLKAVPFNGKIYIIYGAPNGKFHVQTSSDGEKWTHVLTFGDADTWGTKFLGEIDACVVTKNGQQMLCVVILGTEVQNDWGYLRFIDMRNKLMEGGTHFYLDWVSPHHGVSIVPGTVNGSSAGQAVQIFAQSSSWEWYTHVRTCTIDVESYNFEGWRNLPIKVSRPRLSYCDAVEAVLPVSKNDKTDLKMRKYLVMFSDIEWGQVGAAVFKSDLYSPDGPPLYANSSNGQYRDKKSWYLAGVIHGVPPFTRNGNRAKTSIGQVVYAREGAQGSTYDFEFEAEAWLNLAGLAELTAEDQGVKAEAGINFKDALSLGWGWKERIESTRTSTFFSDGNNKDGALGQLIYLAPTFKSQPYCIYDQAGKLKLLSYNLVNVSNMNLEFEEFRLEEPPKGMEPRAPTSNLKYWWRKVPVPPYDPYNFDVFSNNITVTRSKNDETFLSRSWQGYFKVGNKATVQLYMNGSILFGLGLKGEAGAGLSFTFTHVHEDSWGEKMTYSLPELLAYKADSDTKIDKMIVEAVWYSPKPQTNLKNIMRPGWVPDSCMEQTQVPWLLTWQVVDVQGTMKE